MTRLKRLFLAFAIALFATGIAYFRSLEQPVVSSSPSEPNGISVAEDNDSESGELISEDVLEDTPGSTSTATATAIISNAAILRVVDGDTFDAELDGVGNVRIRMLGVNTPETVDPRKAVECFGKASSDFSKKTLVKGSRILLEADPQADERDKYGRLLRNVILADGTDYNALLIREGYAYAYLGFPLNPERKVELKRLENDAKAEKRGLWGVDCR